MHNKMKKQTKQWKHNLLGGDNNNNNEKSAQRDAKTARALAVVRFGHCPLQTGPITIHCAAKFSAQCNKETIH